ncbi:MAG: thiamine-phosphate kinase [Candidatus Omnitrophota bacterium]
MKNIIQIGEFRLIERIKKNIIVSKDVVCGIGDDTAVLKYTKDKYLLLTSDMLVEGVHFTKMIPVFYIGRKALAVSLSDIAAMGGIPKYANVSIGLPKNTKMKFVDDLYHGINSLAKKYKINIVGGDTVRSQKIVIDVTVIGEVSKAKLILRDRARKGDLLFVSGPLGGSIRKRHYLFEPQIKQAQYLVSNFKINSMIDLSDSLAISTNIIAKQSNVGIVLYENLIPINAQSNIHEALFMGEDFKLLFTVPKEYAKKLIKDKNFYEIGEVVDKILGVKFINKNCKEITLKPKGFKHF